MTENPPHLDEFEFKGKKLQPFSKGRLTLATAAGIRIAGNGSIKDVLGIIFLCSCAPDVRVLAQMNPALFWEKQEEWENGLDLWPGEVDDEGKVIKPGDYQIAGELVAKMLKGVTATKAEPIEAGDMSQLPDPSPNLPSQTT